MFEGENPGKGQTKRSRTDPQCERKLGPKCSVKTDPRPPPHTHRSHREEKVTTP